MPMTNPSNITKQDCTLIRGGIIVTVDSSDAIFEPGYVLIDGPHITSVGRMTDAPPDDTAAQVIDARGCLVMPGLINVHTHAAMACLRGLADDLPLQIWLEQYIFPAESRFVNPDFVYQGTLLAGMEMIRSGTTCFCDGYFFEDAAVRAVADLGLRAVLGQGILDFPTPDVADPCKALHHARQYLERCPATDRVTPTLFCHSAYTCSPETLRSARDLCEDYAVPLLIHVAETETEVTDLIKRYGSSPLSHLHRVGILDHPIIAAHCVWIQPKEYSLLEQGTIRVAHCPESNMKLASGIAPIPDYLDRGITVGLGTDGCASNNDLDMFAEMDTAAKIHKVIRRDPSVMNARAVVRMATIEGARVLGLHNQIGSLEPGKKADLIILDWNQPHLVPIYNYYSHLVYAAAGYDVISVMVDGKLLMERRQVLTAHEHDTLEAVRHIGENIKRSRK